MATESLLSEYFPGGGMTPTSCLLLENNVSSWHLPVKVGQGRSSGWANGAQVVEL